MSQSYRQLPVAIAVCVGLSALLGGLAGCEEPPGLDQLETTIDYRVAPAGEQQSVRQDLLSELRQADTRVWAAVAGDAMDAELGEALVDAHERGLDVKIVADADDKGTEGFQALQDAGVPTTWGDGGFRYLPNPTLAQIVKSCSKNDSRQIVRCTAQEGDSPCPGGDEGGQGSVCRPGEFNLMSHRFVIVDKRTVWNIAGGFADQGSAGGTLAWRAKSERIREDFEREFRQMFGGVMADSLDEYNGPNKSTTDPHVDYFSNQGVVALRFNPQERLLKHVIDSVYRARSSVRVITPTLRNPFLLNALEYKAQNGFDVDVVVGQGTQPEGPAQNRLRALGARSHAAGTDLPTVVLIDTLSGENERNWPREALVLSHPLYHAQPLKVERPPEDATGDVNDEVVVFPSDHFVDGNLWRIYEYETAEERRAKVIDRIDSYVDGVVNRAQEL